MPRVGKQKVPKPYFLPAFYLKNSVEQQ